MKHYTSTRKQTPGFALIATISIMILLVMIALAMLSLSTIELRNNQNGRAMAEAQANARLALMLAMGELQKSMGPDQRISASSDILSDSAVPNPHLTGVWDSWIAGDPTNANVNVSATYPSGVSHHQTVGAQPDDSMRPDYANKNDHFRGWLLSLDPADAQNITSPIDLTLDGSVSPSDTDTAVTLVAEGSLGNYPTTPQHIVNARLLSVMDSASSTISGRYGWWIGDESQKARIMGDSYERESSLTLAEQLLRAQAPGSTGTRVARGLETLNAAQETRIGTLPSLKTMDLLIENNPQRPAQRNFHSVTSFSKAVLSDVREGGLKRDLSTLLERPIVPLADETSVADINDFMLYRFTTKDGVFASSAPQEVVPVQDLAAYYQLYSNGNSDDETGVLGRTDTTARGVQYDSSYLSGGPHLLGVNYGTIGDNHPTLPASPIYPREYTAQYRQPRILKIQLLFSMFAEERDNWRAEANRRNPVSTLNSHELLVGVTPAITFWNPTNLPVFMQMDSNQLLANMTRIGDLPLQFRFTREDPAGNQFISSYRTWLSLAGVSDGLNLYWSGKYPVYLEPGEVKTYSLPYSGDLSSLKSQIGYRGHWYQGWAMSSFFMKTDEYFEGHEVREGWEPETFILLHQSAAGTNTVPAPTPGQPDLREVVNGRLRFKSTDRITVDIGCNGGQKIMNFGSKQSSYQRFNGNGINGTTQWDRGHFHLSSYDAGRSDRAPAQDFNRELFRRGMPGGLTEVSSPSRLGSSIINRSDFAAGWPFLQHSFMAGCETSESSNGGIMGGRKFASRPFLHSSPLSGSPFLDANTGNSLYNFGWNWSASLINDVFEAPIQLNNDNQGFYGGGYTAESGTTHVIQQEIPLVPPISIAALSPAQLGGYSVAVEDGMPYGNNPGEIRHVSAGARRTVLTRAVGHGGLLPYSLQSIGNSYAHPQLDADKAFKVFQRDLSSSVGRIDETFADHSYLANKALWDDYFFSSISPQPSRLEVFDSSSSRDARRVAGDFFLNDQPLPNRRMQAYSKSVMDDSKLDDLYSEYGLFQNGLADKIAAYLMVDGPFNINSTSVEAWKVLFSSLKGKPVAYLEKSDAMSGGDPIIHTAHTGTPVGQIGLAGGAPYSGSQTPSETDQWTSPRELTDDEIEQLAIAMVEQVKLRGPFLSLSEFVNRRLDSSNPELAVKGALQAALDDEDVTINEAFREDERKFSNAEIASMNPDFPEAAEGPIAYGSLPYVDQADMLRNFAGQLTPRGDTFVIRTYGDSLDTNGNVVARAWCEAVVQRVPEYIDSSSASGDEPETKQEDLQSITNRNFGRKMQIISFRWLNSSEV